VFETRLLAETSNTVSGQLDFSREIRKNLVPT
jgi:hypothetical protein